jgi:hypothetical protein
MVDAWVVGAAGWGRPGPCMTPGWTSLNSVDHDGRELPPAGRTLTHPGRPALATGLRVSGPCRIDSVHEMPPATQKATGQRVIERARSPGSPSARVIELIDSWVASTADTEVTEALVGARQRLDEPLRIGLAGRSSVGKSTVANALLGEPLAPTGAADTTRVCRGAGTPPQSGPYDELCGIFDGIPYSYGRRHVAAALAATDPKFAETRAVEYLWDREPEVREIGVGQVNPDDPSVRGRLQVMAADWAEDPDKQRAAQARLDQH